MKICQDYEISMFKNRLLTTPMAEKPRHGDIIAELENVLRTVFFYVNENSFKNCLQLSDSFCS